MITLNRLIPLTNDDFFERSDYERLAERFPAPAIRRAASPEDIAGLTVGRHIDYLGTFVQFIDMDCGSQGYCLTLQITDETGHMQALLWMSSEDRARELIEQIGDGKEAVVSGTVYEWPLGSGDKRMNIREIDSDRAIPEVVESPISGVIHTIMQIVPALERVPQPYSGLAVDCIEQNWDELLVGVDTESVRHRYHGGILDHLRAVLKVLQFIWDSLRLDSAMVELITKYQSTLVDEKGIRGYYPMSADHLHQIFTKSRQALEGHSKFTDYLALSLAAVMIEVGKLSSRVRVRVMESLTYALRRLVDELVLSQEDADRVLHLVSRGFGNLETARTSDELALYMANYVASAVG